MSFEQEMSGCLLRKSFSRLATYITKALSRVIAVTFSLFFLAAVFVVGATTWAYVRCEKRRWRRHAEKMRRYGDGMPRAKKPAERIGKSEIIEGEAVHITDERTSEDSSLRP